MRRPGPRRARSSPSPTIPTATANAALCIVHELAETPRRHPRGSSGSARRRERRLLPLVHRTAAPAEYSPRANRENQWDFPPVLSPLTRRVRGTDNVATPSIASLQDPLGPAASRSGASTINSSWTWRISRASNPALADSRSTRIIGHLDQVGALPWIGVLIAIAPRPPAAPCSESMSEGAPAPMMVTTYRSFRAVISTFNVFLTPGVPVEIVVDVRLRFLVPRSPARARGRRGLMRRGCRQLSLSPDAAARGDVGQVDAKTAAAVVE